MLLFDALAGSAGGVIDSGSKGEFGQPTSNYNRISFILIPVNYLKKNMKSSSPNTYGLNSRTFSGEFFSHSKKTKQNKKNIVNVKFNHKLKKQIYLEIEIFQQYITHRLTPKLSEMFVLEIPTRIPMSTPYFFYISDGMN